MSAPEGWEGLLEPGETILWQGRPDPAITFRDVVNGRMIFGLFFALFATFWTFAAYMMGGGRDGFVVFLLVGGMFVLTGLYMVIGVPFVTARTRRHTQYTLTDRAAFIATDPGGRRKLTRIPFAEMNVLELDDNLPGSVIFKREIIISHYHSRSRQTGMRRRRTSRTEKTTGFERIEDARKVYRQLVDLTNKDRQP